MINLPVNRKTLTMPMQKVKAWTLAAVIAILGFGTLPAAAQNGNGNGAAPASSKLDNASCLTCHDGKKEKPKGKDVEGEPRDLLPVDPGKFGKSVHSTMQCVACHTEIVDSKAQHKINTKAAKPDCATCHEAEWNKLKSTPQAQRKERMGQVVDTIEEYKKSFHARLNKDDTPRPFATCNECHNTHTFDVPAKKDTEARAKWKSNNPKLCGASCHEDQLEEYTESIHGQQLLEEDNTDAATCSDCHTSHSVGNTSAQTIKQAITESCGDCHEKEFKSYERTKHGKVAKHAGANTIRCADCHGSHGVSLLTKLPDARKTVAQDNKMCMSCHNSDKAFEKFAPELVADKGVGKEPRPDLDKIHSWLPNAQLHWKAVRCVDCHTSAEEGKSHELLNDEKAQRQCVTCHTRDSALATRLYRHLAEEEEQKYGFANSVILANSYVVGATQHPLLDSIVLAVAALTLGGVLIHGAIRIFTARLRRRNGK